MSDKDVVPKYRSNPLTDFDNGVGLDLRVKIATELLKSPGLWATGNERPALLALDTASDLLELAGARGLLYPVADHDDLSSPLRKHIARNVRAQALQQTAGGRMMREESGAVMPMGAMAFPGANG